MNRFCQSFCHKPHLKSFFLSFFPPSSQVDANREMNAVVNDCLQAMIQRNVVDEARRELLLAATHTEEMISYMPLEVQAYISSKEFTELVHAQVRITSLSNI